MKNKRFPFRSSKHRSYALISYGEITDSFLHFSSLSSILQAKKIIYSMLVTPFYLLQNMDNASALLGRMES